MPAGEAWPAWRKPPASWWATCCFPPLGEQVWELGWFFRRDTWGKGFATEASRALLCHAFQTLSAREVVAETIDTGRAARVLEKLWFRREGAQPVESPAGGRTLLYQYALRAKDWEREK